MISYILTKGRGKFKTCEDSLTSAVFDYLKYLPTDLFWGILRKAMYQNKLPKHFGKLLSIEYWPKWDADATLNKNFIEPDVFLRFENFDLIIEAKRFDVGGQIINQLNNEIQAYKNENGHEDKKLYFIKLGGLLNYNNEVSADAIICKTDWYKLLNEIVILKAELEKFDYLNTDHFIRLLDDCIEGFSLHQFHHLQWLKDLPKIKIKKTTTPLNYE